MPAKCVWAFAWFSTSSLTLVASLLDRPKKNVLVPRFFLLFSLLDVPYISRRVAAKIPVQAWAVQKSAKYFLTFSRFVP